MVGAHEERVAASAGWAKMWGGRFTMYFLDKMQTCKHHFTCDWGVKLSGMGCGNWDGGWGLASFGQKRPPQNSKTSSFFTQ